MKPLSEFVEDLRADGKDLSGDAFLVNRANCDLLQAWLREADEWMREDEAEGDSTGSIWIGAIREELLGTTQKPKQEGESSK